MNISKPIVPIILLFAIIILATLFSGRLPEKITGKTLSTIEVTSVDFNVTIDAIGKLDAARSHMISSTIRGDKGKIIYIIADGSRVEKDEVLIRLDPTPFEEEVQLLTGQVKSLEAAYQSATQMLELEKNNIEQAVKTAEFNIRVAKLELRKLVEGSGPIQLAQYQDDVAKSEEEFRRHNSYVKELKSLLVDEDHDTASEMYLAEKKMKELKKKYKSAKQKLSSYETHVLPTSIEAEKAKVEKYDMEFQQTKQGSVYKIAKAVAESLEIKGKLDTSQALLLLATQELDKTVIKAPFAGFAILSELYRQGQKRKPRIGDRVVQNQPLLYFPDISEMIVQTRIREIDLYKVHKGQQCSVRADAYPNAVYQGKISAIGAIATERQEGSGGERFFQLTVTLTNNDTRLRPGMTARVVIMVDNRKNVIAVPIHAIFKENKETFCYRRHGGTFEKVPVSLGTDNHNMIEIVSGIEPGDTISVIQPPPDLIEQ